MKSWAEMDAAGRGGVVAVVGAVIAALFYGAWTVSRPPQVEETVVTATGTQVEPEPVVEAAPAVGEPIADAAPAAPSGAASDAVADAGDAEPAAEAVAEEAAPPLAAAVDAAEPAQVPSDAADAVEGATPSETETVMEAPAPSPPVFDLVRVEQDGSALVAGSALAGATISLKVTGAELAAVPTDGQGKFVAMFNLAPSAAPRVLSMSMALPDGSVVPAEATVVIGPTIAPVAVATMAQETTEAGATEVTTAAEEVPAPVAEATAPAALLVTEDGARVLQSSGDIVPELVANVTIDTITYTEAGAVQLAGRGTAERVVRLYLDNSQVAETPIGTAGDWAVTLSDVAAGIYTLRADQLDATGKVTSRFETPFKRETVEALASVADATAAEAMAEAETAADTAATAGTEVADSGAEEGAAADTAPALTVTVQPGFTLWRIATENLGEGIRYVQVFEANRDQIRDPDLIYPGQVFTIPGAQ